MFNCVGGLCKAYMMSVGQQALHGVTGTLWSATIAPFSGPAVAQGAGRGRGEGGAARPASDCSRARSRWTAASPPRRSTRWSCWRARTPRGRCAGPPPTSTTSKWHHSPRLDRRSKHGVLCWIFSLENRYLFLIYEHFHGALWIFHYFLFKKS